jgi:hypothetical protein
MRAKKEWTADFPESDPVYQFFRTVLQIWMSKQTNVEEALVKLAQEIELEEVSPVVEPIEATVPESQKPRKPRAKKSVPLAE